MRCVQENTSWNETSPVNFHFPVSSSEECQKLCQVGKYVWQAIIKLWHFKDEVNCTAWTWTNEENEEISVGVSLSNTK